MAKKQKPTLNPWPFMATPEEGQQQAVEAIATVCGCTPERATKLLRTFGTHQLQSGVLTGSVPRKLLNKSQQERLSAALVLSDILAAEHMSQREASDTSSRAAEIAFRNGWHRSPTEAIAVICLDEHGCASAARVVTTGTPDRCRIEPGEVLAVPLIAGADGFVLLHNHPSGQARPSRSDDEATIMIAKAAKAVNLVMQDHIIVAQDATWYSYSDNKPALLRA